MVIPIFHLLFQLMKKLKQLHKSGVDREVFEIIHEAVDSLHDLVDHHNEQQSSIEETEDTKE